MSDRPDEFCFAHNPLRAEVETSAGSREFRTDPRIKVEKLTLGSNGIESQAQLQVFAGPIYTDPPGVEAGLTAAEVLSGGGRDGFGTFITPDQEIRIYRDDPTAYPESIKIILFAGYCRSPRYEERGGSPSERSFSLLVRPMSEAMSTTPHCQIYGRYMRSAAAQDLIDKEQARSTTTAWEDEEFDCVLVTSERCVFNAGGLGNRAAAPIEVTINEQDELLYVFTSDADPDAKMWTFAQALRYLMYFYMIFGFEDGEYWGDGNLFSSTRAFIKKGASQRPKPPVSDDAAFEFAMLGEPRNVNCDGLSLPEALVVMADAARIRFMLLAVADGTATPSNLFWFYAKGAGPAKILSKQAVLDARDLSPEEILAQNTVKDLSFQAVYEDVITRPIFLGDVRRYEVTVELVPGWKPNEHLDDVADAEAALAYAEAHWDLDEVDLQADPWFGRYHKGGHDFQTWAEVGRRWVLNETGRYRADDYARDAGPYVEDTYVPWEPSGAEIKDSFASGDGTLGDVGLVAGEWARRPRPLRPCFSADKSGRSLGIYVEFSFDGGDTWYNIPECRILNLDDEAGIYVDADDLTTIVMPGDDVQDPSGTYFWKAMVDDVACVRVTAVIEGDERIEPVLDGEGINPAIAFATSHVFDVSAKYHCNRRDAANSIFRLNGPRHAPNETVETGDDLLELQRMAEGVLDMLAGRQNAAAATIPWLTTDYQPLDSISEISGMGLQLLSHGAGRETRRTDIVAVEYVGAYTRLIFEDERLLTQVEF